MISRPFFVSQLFQSCAPIKLPSYCRWAQRHVAPNPRNAVFALAARLKQHEQQEHPEAHEQPQRQVHRVYPQSGNVRQNVPDDAPQNRENHACDARPAQPGLDTPREKYGEISKLVASRELGPRFPSLIARGFGTQSADYFDLLLHRDQVFHHYLCTGNDVDVCGAGETKALGASSLLPRSPGSSTRTPANISREGQSVAEIRLKSLPSRHQEALTFLPWNQSQLSATAIEKS